VDEIQYAKGHKYLTLVYPIDSSVRCSRPQPTTYSTASHTWSQEVWKVASSFLPGELARPAGQKQHTGSGQRVLAIAPGNLLDHHATIPALDPTHAVQQENQKAPQRNELKAPLGKMIVTRCRSVAP